MKALLKIVFFSIFILIVSSKFSIAQNKRGLWVWNTPAVVATTNETNILINQCKLDNITEIYLYAYNLTTTALQRTRMRTFISKANCNNINVWAMDGYRAYFSDWTGPTPYYNFINTVISYNSASAANERFYGVHGDNEPQDGQAEPLSSFHNGIRSSLLSTVPGSGVWQSTAALDREFLMRDWCLTTETAQSMCIANGMKYGQAMPSWVDDYFGEPVYCTYNAVYKRVMEHIMDYLHSYCIMTYNTTPANAANRGTGELTYAGTMPLATRPEVWVSVETHCGAGATISYCDTPPKNTKAAVYTDITAILTALSAYPALTGLNIHDWAVTGWKELPTAASNIADPGCSLPISLLFFKGNNYTDKNVLTWSTIEELNFSHFEIEYSINGIDFNKIDTEIRLNENSKTKNYTASHIAYTSASHYYRLKSIDKDGTFNYSTIINLISQNQLKASLSPSSSTNLITLNLYDDLSILIDLTIIDTKGTEMNTIALDTIKKNKIPIDISNLSGGIYYLRMKFENENPIVLKFLKL